MASILKVDDLRGNTAAGDITITSEGGSATQSLQQGLAKLWMQGQGDATVTDSFNQASMTDGGTGVFTSNFTNNMNNDDYSGLSTGNAGDHLISGTSTTTTSGCRFDHYNQSNASTDAGLHCAAIFGDLA